MTHNYNSRLIAIAAAATLLSACGKSSNVSTQSSGAGNAPAGGTVLVAAGTDFYGRLQQPIGSKTSHDGDTFTLAQTDTMLHHDAALHGSVIDGHLDNITAAGLGKKPSMTIIFDDIKMADGTKAPINVQLVSANAFDAKTHRLRTIGLMIGGAMAAHAVTHGHGGLMGAAAGYVMSQEMKTDISVPAGTVLELKFKTPATTAPTAQ